MGADVRCDSCGAREQFTDCLRGCPNYQGPSESEEQSADLATRRFEFLLRIIESGEWNGLRALAEKEGLL
jgi:hypothetical protein